MSRLWVLGASDPEMAAIETMLRECGETVRYATIAGRRVSAGDAYRMDAIPVDATPWGGHLYLVECGDSSVGSWRLIAHPDSAGLEPSDIPSEHYVTVLSVDHHRPGDAGYGRTPEDFFGASSAGQVWAALSRLGLLSGRPSPSGEIILIAAADHCLGHAYAGRCPGVDPDRLLRHRVAQQVAFRARNGGSQTVESAMADIAAAKDALDSAVRITLSHTDDVGTCDGCGIRTEGDGWDYCECATVRDMRGRLVPGLPDAGTRYGLAYVADGLPGPEGRVKTVCSGDAETIRAFFGWASREGLVDAYGDPARGFAGAYGPARNESVA